MGQTDLPRTGLSRGHVLIRGEDADRRCYRARAGSGGASSQNTKHQHTGYTKIQLVTHVLFRPNDHDASHATPRRYTKNDEGPGSTKAKVFRAQPGPHRRRTAEVLDEATSVPLGRIELSGTIPAPAAEVVDASVVERVGKSGGGRTINCVCSVCAGVMVMGETESIT